MDKELWPKIVQPIVLEEELTAEVYQTENGIPLLRIQLESLDCAIYITLESAQAIGELANRAKGLHMHDNIH